MYDLIFVVKRRGSCGKHIGRTWCEGGLPSLHCPHFHHPTPLHTNATAWNICSCNYFRVYAMVTCFDSFSRLLSSSGPDLCSQRKHVNISSPCCPSHHGNHSLHVFIQKSPSSQHAQTSWTENSTVHRRREFLACPVALKITKVLLWRCRYF